LLRQVIDTVLAARTSGAVERARVRELEASATEAYADPEVRAFMADTKVAVRAAYMLKAAYRVLDLARVDSNPVTVSHEGHWERVMRGSWQRWMSEIRDAAGRHIAVVAETLADATRPGQTVEVPCSAFGRAGGGLTWAILLGKRWLPVVQSAVRAHVPGATVDYSFGRFRVTR
jgi:hypothetical protein